MIDEMTAEYVDPMGQHGLQNLSRRGSWNPVSSPSSPLSRVTSATPTGSRLGVYTMPFYVSASPRIFRKDNGLFDISDTDKHEIRLAFELFDTRKVGRLGYRDLKVAMRALECDVKKAEVLKLMQKYSKEDKNEIGSNEFMKIMIRKYKEKDPELNISKVYAVFDEEGEGKISVKNVRKVARDLGEFFTDDQIEAMINEFDKDGDGEGNTLVPDFFAFGHNLSSDFFATSYFSLDENILKSPHPIPYVNFENLETVKIMIAQIFNKKFLEHTNS